MVDRVEGLSDNPSPQDVMRVIANPPPALSYGRVSTGPETSINYDLNRTDPYDGSDKLLRALSPFVLRLEPPVIFQSDPSFLDRSPRRSKVHTYSRARNSAARSGFFSARASLGSSKWATGSIQGHTPEEFVAKSSGERFEGISGVSRSTSGSGPAHAGNMRRPSITDLNTALDIARQLDAVVNTPPLVLLINPQSLSLTVNKLQQFTDRSRYGFIMQAWGQEQEKINITAKCGAFISGGRGVHRASKKDSAAWQNLAALLHFYKNNGYIYDTIGKSNAHHMVGAVSISYDQWTYIGHMESLSFAYDEQDELGGTTFTIDFVVSQKFDHSVPVDGVVKPLRSPMSNALDSVGGSTRENSAVSLFSQGVADPTQAGEAGQSSPQAGAVTQYTPNMGGFRAPGVTVEDSEAVG